MLARITILAALVAFAAAKTHTVSWGLDNQGDNAETDIAVGDTVMWVHDQVHCY